MNRLSKSGLAAGIIVFLSFTNLFAQESISIQTTDNIEVFGEYYYQSTSAFVILLFHQAGSNAKAEYSEHIVPRLMEEGYSVIAVDQRKGGSSLGGTNRTSAQVDESSLTYCDAYPDLVATLEYADRLDKKIVVWGSSYSAALVLKLANDFPGVIKGVLAFSPASGGPMGDCSANNYIEGLQLPVLVFRPAKEAAIASVQSQIELFRSNGIETYVSAKGVHGSSMLNPDRAEGVEDVWKQVLTFLANLN